MTEKQTYQLIESLGELEIRRYPEHAQLQIDAAGEFFPASNRAFMPLVRYIGGNNLAAEKISMTAPVIQETVGPSKHVVSFVMPGKYKKHDLAAPLDSSLTIVEVPEHYAAALKFRGAWNNEKFEAMGKELLRRVERAGLKPVGNLYWARFDPPIKPGFMKRNEVLIKIENPMEGNS